MMRPLFALLLCSLLSPALFAAEPLATVLQPTTLRAEPFADAAPLATLKAKQQVRVVQRKGGWYQVRSGQQRGWLRMSHLRLGDGATAPKGDSGVAQTLRFLGTGRSGADGVTVATGIRGLDAADMANAKPDHRALQRLDRYQAQPEQARQFAASARLKSQPLGYFEAE
ncbi:MAG: SH3 domain-containing protein [Gammaproteobacteria bacterium]|nr:SH3 domain-containing protein [Gammaproteobacteria bacterium]